MFTHTYLMQAQAQGGGGFQMLILMGGMFLIMYLFMIRPQMKKMKETKKFQSNLQVGDQVVTIGGIHGKILEIHDTDVVIALDQGRMRVAKAALAADVQSALSTQK